MSRFIEKFSAILNMKCPRCEKGKMFSSGLFEFSKFLNMPEKCEHCGMHFTPEPGFYYGALFVSYAFNVVLMVMVSVILYFFISPPEWVYGSAD